MTTSLPHPRPPEATGAPGGPSRGQSWRGRLLALLLIGGGWLACLHLPTVWAYTGIGQTPVPFLDLYGSLAVGEVAHAGGDPYLSNPLDPFHRPHLYSRWWLVTAELGLTRADTLWLGYTLLGATLLAALALLRPQTKRELLQTALLLCSPAILMAVSRANNDLVIFLVVCVALALLRSAAALPRALAAALFALAAVLKYYPLAALIVLFAVRSKRERIVGLAITGVVLLLACPALEPALLSLSRNLPRPGGFYSFGAGALPREFGLFSAAWWLAPAALLIAWAAWLAKKRQTTLSPTSPPASARPHSLTPSSLSPEFACGAAFVVGCFFLGASYVYKLIFAVWLLPWLWRAPPSLSPTESRWRRATLVLLFTVVWWEGLLALVINLGLTAKSVATLAYGVYNFTFVLSQLFTWALVVCLTRYLVFYVVDHTRAQLHPNINPTPHPENNLPASSLPLSPAPAITSPVPAPSTALLVSAPRLDRAFWLIAVATVVAWVTFQLGWMTAHVFNATRFILYDQGSYLYAVDRWQAGEALYRDFAWQYGPLALGWYRAFAAVGGNSPLLLVIASSTAFALAWVLTAQLVIRVAGRGWGSALAVLALLPAMSPSGVTAINGPHGAVEMLLLASIASVLGSGATLASTQRWAPWVLGLLCGLLQWVRFGPHAMALAGIGLIIAWQRWPLPTDAKNFLRSLVAFMARVVAGYALCVAPLIAWYFVAYPAAGAWEQLWPRYMVAHYAATYPNRWPQISSAREVIQTWLPAALAVALALWLLVRGFTSPRKSPLGSPSASPADSLSLFPPVTSASVPALPPRLPAVAGVLFFPLYYALGCVGLFRNDYTLIGHLWLAWPGLALIALLPRPSYRLLAAAAIVPAMWAALANVWAARVEEQAWHAEPRALPNGQNLWFRASEERRFGQLQAALGPVTAGRPVAVFLGGGGVHYFFGTQRIGRHWWYLPEFVRPWETDTAWAALLKHERLFVTDLGQSSVTPATPGALALWLPIPAPLQARLLPHLKNPRHIDGVGDVLEIVP